MLDKTKTVASTEVNGINVDDLFALIEDVRRDAAKGKTNWRVTTSWQGQARSRAKIESFGMGGERIPRRFSIDIDEPCELGGSNRFANPQEHLIAALNACITVGYVAQCAVRGITLESLQSETEGVFAGWARKWQTVTRACATPFVSGAAVPASNSRKSMTR